MKITICGGGNLGHVCAGFLASQEAYEVSLLTTHPERWSSTIEVTDLTGHTYHGSLAAVSAKPEMVIPQADMVLICLPGFAIHETLVSIAPWLRQQTWVGTVVSSTGFFFEAMNVLPKSQPLFGFQRVPFISRIITYGQKAELKGYKESLNIAVEQTCAKEEIRVELERQFHTPVKLLKSYYEVSLSNSNPLLHPARLYAMWKDWYPGISYDKNPYFYSDWTVEASEFLIKMDDEFQNLLRKLNLEEGSIPRILDYYESHDVESLTNKLRSIQAFQGILSPMLKIENSYIPDFSSRYFTEDFPYGMKYIIEIAKKHDVNIPIIQQVYKWGISKI